MEPPSLRWEHLRGVGVDDRLDTRHGDPLWLAISIFRDGLPVAAMPTTGELKVETREVAAWAF